MQTKQLFLSEALKIVPFEGWKRNLLEEVSENLSMPYSIGKVLFPYGNIQIIELFVKDIDDQMLEEYVNIDTFGMKVHEKILTCLKARFSIMGKNKAAMHKTLSFLLLPWNLGIALKMAWKTVDKIWYEAGMDQSVDFNYYTKRSLLMGVYSSSLLYWVSDDSENCQNTIKFMERRIADVLKIGGTVRKICQRVQH